LRVFLRSEPLTRRNLAVLDCATLSLKGRGKAEFAAPSEADRNLEKAQFIHRAALPLGAFAAPAQGPLFHYRERRDRGQQKRHGGGEHEAEHAGVIDGEAGKRSHCRENRTASKTIAKPGVEDSMQRYSTV
jgi:hypothetical protein